MPKIEEKLERPVGYLGIDQYIWLGKWMNRQVETAIYIINCYFGWQILPKYYNQLPLKKIGYRKELITKKEVFFSVLLIVVEIVTVISGVTGFVLAKMLNIN